MPPQIHDSAIVEDGAAIGPDTKVWHHAHVRTGAVIGARCVLGKNVFVDSGARLGDGCRVQNNVSVYSGVTLEDDVFVGPSAVFTNDRNPRAFGDWVPSPTHVRRGASIGAGAVIVCGSTIGEYALVAAGAVVTKPVRPHQLVVGNPARHAGWVDRAGDVISRDPEPPTGLDEGSA